MAYERRCAICKDSIVGKYAVRITSEGVYTFHGECADETLDSEREQLRGAKTEQ